MGLAVVTVAAGGLPVVDVSPVTTGPATTIVSVSATYVTRTNGNLTVTKIGADNFTVVLSNDTRGTQKAYCEVRVDAVGAAGECGPGIALSTQPLAGTASTGYLGENATSWCYFDDGTIYNNATVLFTKETLAAGNWVGVAVDRVAKLVWFRNITKNGVWTSYSIAALGSADVCAAYCMRALPHAATFNFDGPFLGAPPAGDYKRWGGNDVSALSRGGLPVTEAANGRGIAVTKVAARGLPVVYETIGVASAAYALDPATATSTALSNGNLTATHSDTVANTGVRGAPAKSSGKYYFEVTVNVVNTSDKIGIIPSASGYGAIDVYVAMNSNMNVAGVAVGNLGGGFIGTDVVCVAVDLSAGLVWFRKNGGNWNNNVSANPAAGTLGWSFTAGSPRMPGITFAGVAGTQYTMNFGATSYARVVPSGFGNWTA